MGKISFAEKLKNLFGGKSTDDDFFDELTDALVEGDIGAKIAFEMTDALAKTCREKHIREEAAVVAELKSMLRSYAKEIRFEPEPEKVSIFMMLGVNGVGKTTTAAKLARYYTQQGKPVLMAAADTFRAAAEEQLEMHGSRLGVRVVSHQHGGDPSAVVFDAASAAKAQGGALVIADTAGRLHNKENLVRELQKIDRIAAQKADAGCYKKLLVIDATTGQNAVRQAEVFHEAVGVDGVVLTKYDSTARGGVAFSIGREMGLPVAFVCTGEGYDDIQPFDAESYTDEFLGR
ncbi:MAG: signal recognition particle-docking protein FtsY [Treponema sp.]|nr:signal recognition particle-docking protein FtsY [Treponema sp.]